MFNLGELVRASGKGGIGSPDRRHTQTIWPGAPGSCPGAATSRLAGAINNIGAYPSQSVSTALAILSPFPRL